MAGWRYIADGVLHRTFSRQTDEVAGVVQPLAIGEIFGVGEVSPGRVFEGLHQAVSLHGNEPITGAAVDFTHNVADDAAHRDPTKWRPGYRNDAREAGVHPSRRIGISKRQYTLVEKYRMGWSAWFER